MSESVMNGHTPDGWAAFHKDRGWNLMSLNQVGAETARMMHCDEEHGGEDYGCDDLDAAWERAVEDGWQIRPVYLSTEPPQGIETDRDKVREVLIDLAFDLMPWVERDSNGHLSQIRQDKFDLAISRALTALAPPASKDEEEASIA